MLMIVILIISTNQSVNNRCHNLFTIAISGGTQRAMSPHIPYFDQPYHTLLFHIKVLHTHKKLFHLTSYWCSLRTGNPSTLSVDDDPPDFQLDSVICAF